MKIFKIDHSLFCDSIQFDQHYTARFHQKKSNSIVELPILYFKYKTKKNLLKIVFLQA